MFEKPQSPDVLGLDIDGFSLKGVFLSLIRGKLKFNNAFDLLISHDLTENDNVKPLYIVEQNEMIKELSEKNLVVSAVNTQEVLVRPLELKLKKEKDIEATLNFQVEPLLPYPVENAVTDKILLSKDKEGSKLTVFCIRKDHLTQHLETWDLFGIIPEVISAAPQALVIFANQFVDNSEPFFILHLGIENSFGVLVNQDKLIATQALPIGLMPIIEMFAESKGIDTASAYRELLETTLKDSTATPAIKNPVDELRMAITRTIFSLAKQFKGKVINHLIVTGPGAIIEGLTETLCSHLNKTLLPIKELSGFEASRKELLNYALPIGEALSALPNCKNQINFRQQEFLYPEPWKRLKQPVTYYILLCFGIAAALFLFGNAYASYREGAIRQQYIHLLNMMNKPYNTFENELQKKIVGSDQKIIQPGDLSLSEIQKRLNFLENEIQSNPQTFPLLPNTPQVSDVLAWISAHPNFIGNSQEEKQDPSASMHIQSFSYNMVKRPDPTKKQEKYQVKVEMEFSSPAPKMAREFHDALIAPNDMVDPKGEIKWNSNRDLYRTSFYLKDKTAYLNL